MVTTATGIDAPNDANVAATWSAPGWTKSMYRWCEYAAVTNTSVNSQATAIGFVVFFPTDYRGVAELGLIAGSGVASPSQQPALWTGRRDERGIGIRRLALRSIRRPSLVVDVIGVLDRKKLVFTSRGMLPREGHMLWVRGGFWR